MVPFLDLEAAYRELQPEIDAAVARVLRSGRYILGEEVSAFEHAFAAYVGADHCVGVGNGFDALALSLRAIGVGSGDEVIVPSHTYIATWLAVSDVGATPVPVEPDMVTYTIEPSAIQAAVTERTRAIIPVHLYGHPADMDAVLDVAHANALWVVEDAAQAHGARYKGRRIGAHGHLVAWSFYPGKNLGALGDAGAVTTDDFDLARQLRVLGNYGSEHKYVHEVQGRNSRLDPLQAAVLGVKLRYLDDWNRRRAEIAKVYDQMLSDTGLFLPHVREWADHAWHLYVVRSELRNALVPNLADNGIQSVIHYPNSVIDQPAYADYPPSSVSHLGDHARARQLAATVLSLPIDPQLKDATHAASLIRTTVLQGT